jgi:lipoprotein NlpD
VFTSHIEIKEGLMFSTEGSRCMTNYRFRLPESRVSAILAVAALLAGCSLFSGQQPQQDLGTLIPPDDNSAGAASSPSPDMGNADKSAYYKVKPGDTLGRIAASNNQSWRDIVRWNNLANPNRIVVGQTLRIVAPGQVAAAMRITPGANASDVHCIATSADGPDSMNFIWPVKGAVLTGFDGTANKGIDIGGNAGDPVYAAADGRVVYAGANLPGYGNLVILKHNNTFLTAYAHNQAILVNENELVRRGQKIAQMGSTGANQTELHFEIRRLGNPVDPVQYLPPT